MKWAVISAMVLLSGWSPTRAMAQDAGIPVGSKAPDVAVHDLDGNSVRLGDFLGKKPVLLEFWATWCELCEELLPRVKAAHAKYGDRVAFLGVNVTVNQTPGRVRRYLETHQPPFRTLYDDQGASIRAYQVPTTSFVVVMDRGGTVAYTGTGGAQDLTAVLDRVFAP
jgi:thiol-disulfide isomerase/thioredoxin